jgi:hypothetical protein
MSGKRPGPGVAYKADGIANTFRLLDGQAAMTPVLSVVRARLQ